MTDEFDFSPDELDDLGSVTLTLDDDTELECMILGTFTAGEHDYIALLPMTGDEDDEEGDVLLYRYIDHGDDEEPEIANIESDEEYEIAADAFDELMDEEEFDEEDEEE